MKVICEYCGNEFFQPMAWYKRSKHHCCSRECADKLKIRLTTKTCIYCGNRYHKKYHQKNSMYCSENCQWKDAKKEITLECEICHKKYIVNPARKETSKFCSRKCLRVHTGHLASKRVGEKNPRYKGYKDEKRSDKSRLKTWGDEIKRRDKVCVFCKSDNALQAHHIKSYIDYPKLKFNLDNGILLCAKCHALQHKDDKVPVAHLIMSH